MTSIMHFPSQGFFKRNWALFLVLVLSGILRMLSAIVIRGESGGDFYNYLLMAKSFLSGGSIFIEKRLPIYALSLIPGHLTGHPLGYARILGITLSLLTLYLLYRLILDLRLPKITALTSLILLSLQPTFFLFSIRPLSHTLFDLEVILNIFLFYRLSHSVTFSGNSHSQVFPWKFVVFGLLLGVTAMTRHEGFLVAGVLLLCLSVLLLKNWYGSRSEKIGWGQVSIIVKQTAFVLLPFLIIVAPWFISNYLRFGNPIYTEYEADAGLNVARSLQSLVVNLQYMKDIFLGLWGSIGYFSIKKSLIPILICIGWLFFSRKRFGYLLSLGVGALLLIGTYFLNNFEDVSQLFTLSTIGIEVLGFGILLRKLRWSIAPIILIFITQFAFLTYVQPWSRHSQHLFFVPALLFSVGIYELLLKYFNSRWSQFVALASIVPIVLFMVSSDIAAVKGLQRGSQTTLPLIKAGETLSRNYPQGLVLISPKFKNVWSDNSSVITYYLGSRMDYTSVRTARFALDYNEDTFRDSLGLGHIKLLSAFTSENSWSKIYEIIE